MNSQIIEARECPKCGHGRAKCLACGHEYGDDGAEDLRKQEQANLLAVKIQKAQEEANRQIQAKHAAENPKIIAAAVQTALAEERKKDQAGIETERKQFQEQLANLNATINRLTEQIGQKDEQLNQTRKRAEDAERAAIAAKNQAGGNAQLNGKVHEKYIADLLRKWFANDKIDLNQPGKREADILQTVKDDANKSCGTIYYEVKKTTGKFDMKWMETFRQRLQEKGATAGVLVSQVKPGEIQQQKIEKSGETIWIVLPDELENCAKSIRPFVIRESLNNQARKNASGKKDKLYNHVTGQKFRRQVQDLIKHREKISDCARKMETQVKRLRQQLNETYLEDLIIGLEETAEIELDH